MEKSLWYSISNNQWPNHKRNVSVPSENLFVYIFKGSNPTTTTTISTQSTSGLYVTHSITRACR